MEGIWAGDRYSMTSLTTSARAQTQHLSPVHQAITLLIISDTRSAARLPTLIALRDRLRAGTA
jgi:hypothetical protein